MSERLRHGLSKRARQIMEAIYSNKEATAAEVRASIPKPPSYSAVRATLEVLVRRRLLNRRREGRRYVYTPTISRRRAAVTAARNLLSTYFEDSIASALTAMLRMDRKKLTEQDYRKLVELIRRAERGKP